ncbi:MAG: TonB-dependent receptor, partial [Opitutaceae bacterium]|nr:TonB-dependent receptor [Opitutaceae bacterium]
TVTEQAGADSSRAFGFESISLAAIDAVEVYKNLSADLDADAPAGLINMRSKRAFDRKGRRVSYSVGISAVSEELRLGQTPGPGDTNRHKARPNFSLEYSDVFLGGKLGVIFNHNRSSIFNEYLMVSHYADTYAGPDRISFTDGPKITNRSSTSFRVDYKFSRKFSAGVNFMLSDYYAFFDNRQLTVYLHGANGATRANIVGDNPLTAFTTTGGGGYLVASGVANSKLTKTWSLMPSFDWKPAKNLTIEGRFAWSESDNHYKAFGDGHIKNTTNLRLTGVDIAARRSSPTSSDWKITQLGGPDWGLLDNYQNDIWSNPLTAPNAPRPAISDSGQSDFNKVLSASLDAIWKHDAWRLPTFFKAGLKVRTDQREFSNPDDWNVWQYYGRGGDPDSFPRGLASGNLFDLGSHDAALYSTSILPPAFTGRTWAWQTFQAHPEYFMHIGDPDNPDPPANLVGRYYNAFIGNERAIDEQVAAAYAMFGARWKRLQLQAGIRCEHTKDTLEQWAPRTKEEVGALYDGLGVPESVWWDNSNQRANSVAGLQYQYFTKPKRRIAKNYGNAFLSAALKYDATQNLILQLGAHQAIARPALARIAGTVGYSNDNRITAPNPGLLPEESDNYSAKVSWYLPHMGVLSAGIFQIDITNKWYDRYLEPGAWDPAEWGVAGEYLDDWWLVVSGNSSEAARFRGAELEYRQTLGFLPGEFKNTNVYVNYTRTYVRSADPNVVGGVSPPSSQLRRGFQNRPLHLRPQRKLARRHPVAHDQRPRPLPRRRA